MRCLFWLKLKLLVFGITNIFKTLDDLERCVDQTITDKLSEQIIKTYLTQRRGSALTGTEFKDLKRYMITIFKSCRYKKSLTKRLKRDIFLLINAFKDGNVYTFRERLLEDERKS